MVPVGVKIGLKIRFCLFRAENILKLALKCDTLPEIRSVWAVVWFGSI